jgi:hypothetical protein
MLKLDPQKCLAEMQRAETADLLDRVTAYRQGMEPAALTLMEHELNRRGVPQSAIDQRMAECGRECLFDAGGVALQCSRCRRPAVTEVRDWHRLWGVLPLFPRSFRCCSEHRPAVMDG